jgi:hypothetical protein
VDRHGRTLWPPASVPRPHDLPPGTQVWYVVREEEARYGISIGKAATLTRVDASDERSCLIIAAVLIAIVIVALVLLYVLVLAPR